MRPSRPPAPAPRSPEIFVARLQDRLVILDLAGGQYLSLHDPQAHVSAGPKGELTSAAIDLSTALSDAGLLERPAILSTARAPRPDGGFDQTWAAVPKIGISDVAAFVAALAWTALEIQRPLRRLTRVPSSPPSHVDACEMQRQVDVYCRLLVWSPWQGECLFRSRLLLRFLQHKGVTAGWTFGVRGWPFRAHCWVEGERGPVNEAWDKLAAFHVLATF